MALMRLHCSSAFQDREFLTTACAVTEGNLYILPRQNTTEATESLLEGLRRWYTVVASKLPMKNVIPLFDWCQWASGHLTQGDVRTLLTNERYVAEDTPFLKQLNYRRQFQHPALKPLSLTELQCDETPVVTDVDWSPSPELLSFDRVVVGGTFDRLHAGHRLLLSAAALVTKGTLLIGITEDAYLSGKEFRERIQPLEERRQRVMEFVRAVHPGLEVEMSVLRNPADPVVAETDATWEAIVTSKETQRGGEAINESRLRRGFAPLKMIIVGFVGGEGSSKLSSTELRRSEMLPM